MRLAVLGLALAAESGSGRAADPVRVTYHWDRSHLPKALPELPSQGRSVARRMPPWHLARGADAFSNARGLSDGEIDVIRRWAESGAREGDAKDAPPAFTFTDGWMISKPDLVLAMPTDAAIEADGQMESQHFVVPTGFTEDRWIQEIEVRPGNRAVVHHIAVFLRPRESKWMREAKPGEPFVIKSRISGRSPSDDGKAAADRSSIRLVFAKSPLAERVYTIGIADARFVIPPRWNRNWQTTYESARPMELPVGARLNCLAVFDNSANNPVNPDPDAEVRWGDQTTDEMMVVYMDLAFPASLSVDVLFRRTTASK